jgi:hypothetical protein
MGQVASSNINYDMDYKNNSNTKNIKDNVDTNNVITTKTSETQETMIKELLDILKYFSETVDYDNRFVLKNKLIIEELESKLIELDKTIKKNESDNITGKYEFKNKLIYLKKLETYNMYLKIAIVVVLVILCLLYFL